MDQKELGKAGLVGWRAKVADKTADPVAERTPLSSDQARAIIGVLFFALSAYYVTGTVMRALKAARG